jgi:hypothetical protein
MLPSVTRKYTQHLDGLPDLKGAPPDIQIQTSLDIRKEDRDRNKQIILQK